MMLNIILRKLQSHHREVSVMKDRAEFCPLVPKSVEMTNLLSKSLFDCSYL